MKNIILFGCNINTYGRQFHKYKPLIVHTTKGELKLIIGVGVGAALVFLAFGVAKVRDMTWCGLICLIMQSLP